MCPASTGVADPSTGEEPPGSSRPSGLSVLHQLQADLLAGTRALVNRRETAVLLLIPVAVYFWFIHRYGVNAIYYDQWDNVGLLTHTRFFHSYAHTTLPTLWSQHGEDRTFFPNLIVLALGHLTNLNIVTELYLSAVLLLSAFVLIILAHRQDMARTRLILYLPVAFLMFTLGQYENTLFGFQLWLYLVMATMAATIFLLNLRKASWLLLVAAIATAVVGSYSAVDGLIIWPAGLVVLLWKHRPRAFVLTWLTAAVATTGLYFYHFDFSASAAGGGTGTYVLAHPLSAAEFFFFVIGDIMGRSLPKGTEDPDVVAFGVGVLLLAVVCLAVYARHRHLSSSPVGPALICFGVLFAIFVTVGRANLGLAAASQSRFVTEDALILAGCYLCLLDRWPARDDQSVPAGLAATVDSDRKTDPLGGISREKWRQGLLVALRCLAVLLIVVEVEGAFRNGPPAGAATRQMYQEAALVAAHAADAPDSLLKSALFPNGDYADANIRALAEAAKKDHLSFFATSEGARLERSGIPESSQPLLTSVVKPTSGTVVRGEAELIARTSSDYPIKDVDFRISDVATGSAILLRAVPIEFAWLGFWLSTVVPNGDYAVQSIARDVGGHVTVSKAIPFTVRN